jgi:hypothetical protein
LATCGLKPLHDHSALNIEPAKPKSSVDDQVNRRNRLVHLANDVTSFAADNFRSVGNLLQGVIA